MRYLAVSTILAIAYFASAKAGLAMSSVASQITLFWPPTGIAVAALVRFGPRHWPAIWLAAFAVNFDAGSSVAAASCIACGNTLGPLAAQQLLHRVAFQPSLGRTRDVWWFLALGAALPMLAPPTVGVITLTQSGTLAPASFFGAWVRWFLGDALGVLAVAPPLLTFHWRELRRTILGPQRGWFLLGGLTTFLLTAGAFLWPGVSPHVRSPLAYLAGVAVVWSGLKLGMTAGTWLTLLVAVVASVGTGAARGPFALPDVYLGLDLLWVFIATTSLACLLTLALRIEREQMASELSESERRLASVVACLPGLAYRRAPGAQWNPEFLGAKASSLLGYEPAQLLARQPAYDELIAPQDRPRIQAQVEAALALGKPYQLEYRVTDAQGRERWCLEHGDAQRDEHGNVQALEGIVFDNTERKQIEAALVHAQKMEAVGRLAGGIAHDFNNLLLVIIGYAEQLRADKARPHEQGGPAVEQILLTAERATSLVRQLLAYSRKQVVEPKVVKPSALVANLELMLGRLLGSHVRVVQSLEARGDVLADPGQLEQVVMNLVLNAADAMPEGGAIQVKTEDLEITSQPPDAAGKVPAGRYVLLTVSDTGKGMTPDVRERAFEPFFTTKEPGKGSGLGLATVYGVVAQCRGFITLDSEPGRGTTFRIYLPRSAATSEAKERSEQPAPAAAGKHRASVLLVEDDPVVRPLLLQVLQEEHYHVLCAADAAQALGAAAAHEQRIDLLVTDVKLPGEQGPALFKKLLASRPGLRALFISGDAQDALQDELGRRPGVAFLQKPFTPSALLSAIAAVAPGADASGE